MPSRIVCCDMALLFGKCTTQLKTKIDAILKALLKSVDYNSPVLHNDDLFKPLWTFSSLLFQAVIERYYWDDAFLIERRNYRALRMIEHFRNSRIYTNYGVRIFALSMFPAGLTSFPRNFLISLLNASLLAHWESSAAPRANGFFKLHFPWCPKC